MTSWIDRTAMLYRRASIATTCEGNPVTLLANYALLPSSQGLDGSGNPDLSEERSCGAK